MDTLSKMITAGAFVRSEGFTTAAIEIDRKDRQLSARILNKTPSDEAKAFLEAYALECLHTHSRAKWLSEWPLEINCTVGRVDFDQNGGLLVTMPKSQHSIEETWISENSGPHMMGSDQFTAEHLALALGDVTGIQPYNAARATYEHAFQFLDYLPSEARGADKAAQVLVREFGLKDIDQKAVSELITQRLVDAYHGYWPEWAVNEFDEMAEWDDDDVDFIDAPSSSDDDENFDVVEF